MTQTKRILDLPNKQSQNNIYACHETMTLGQLRDTLSLFIAIHGVEYQVRVDTTYDQGQRFMPVTAIEAMPEGYVAIVA